MTNNKHWIYLEKLRRSGATNMWGAGSYLAQEFNIPLPIANGILADWMKNYSQDDYKGLFESDSARVCSVCGKAMTQGFVIGDGEDYYCSEECLYSVYTEQEYIDMYESDHAYWTEWEE